MKNLKEQINRIKNLMLISEQCGGDLDQCETDLENQGYRVFSPIESKNTCDQNENIQCLESSFSSLSGKMTIGSMGSSVKDCFVLLKSNRETNGLPTFHITFYSDGQVILSFLLNEHNDKKKLLYRSKYQCSGGSVEIKGGIGFKYIGVKSGNGAKAENLTFEDDSDNDVDITNSESSAMQIQTGPLKYQDVLTYYMNKKGIFNGNVLNKGLSYSQIETLLTHT
jgi:hypothetical protein